MTNFLKKIFQRSAEIRAQKKKLQDLLEYRESFNQLVKKYEDFLQQFTDYMEESQLSLKGFVQEELMEEENAGEFEVSAFHIGEIKSELDSITEECDALMEYGEERFGGEFEHEEAVDLLMEQLRSLRKYSEEIEEALSEFEQKLLSMEEVLAQQSYLN